MSATPRLWLADPSSAQPQPSLSRHHSGWLLAPQPQPAGRKRRHSLSRPTSSRGPLPRIACSYRVLGFHLSKSWLVSRAHCRKVIFISCAKTAANSESRSSIVLRHPNEKSYLNMPKVNQNRVLNGLSNQCRSTLLTRYIAQWSQEHCKCKVFFIFICYFSMYLPFSTHETMFFNIISVLHKFWY